MLFQLKQNDNRQSLVYIIQDEDGSTPSLVGATVQFVMGKKNKLVINNPATIQSEIDGIVTYDFTNLDTLVSGKYMAEFVVTFPSGERQTFPNRGYIDVNIEQNLDTSQTSIIVDMLAERQGEFTEKLNSILLQAGNIAISAVNEYTWTATLGQVVYVFPSSSNYRHSSKWLEVYVGNIRVDSDLINRNIDNQIELLIDPSLIQTGMRVHAKWTEPVIPVTDGHHVVHEIGGQDEIDIAKLKGYEELEARIAALELLLK